MKHTDLMLNDLVMYQGKILRVGCISDYDIKIDLFEDGEDTPYAEIWQEELDEVKPIPLTAEILDENGFRLIGTVWHYRGYTYDVCVEFTDKIAVRIYNELKPKDEKGRQDMVSYNRDWAQPFYVHELQHALRLCGIDKEIVL